MEVVPCPRSLYRGMSKSQTVTERGSFVVNVDTMSYSLSSFIIGIIITNFIIIIIITTATTITTKSNTFSYYY